LDVDDRRLDRVRENLSRIGKSATLVAADLRQWTDPQPFDRILVDAPCSSTGVIRRHPDIKLLRRSEDIPSLAKVQLEILQSAFRLLKTGGRLLYVTCSVLREENTAVAKKFLSLERGARHVPLSQGLPQEIGAQWLPGAPAGTDGFYYACVEKTTFGT
jgi:16S rRNA (cytosine967-C5)-methyltransferase